MMLDAEDAPFAPAESAVRVPSVASRSGSGAAGRLGPARDLTFGPDGSMWALTCDARCGNDGRQSIGSLLRLSPRTGRVLSSLRLDDPDRLAVGESGVWVASFWRSTLTRVDPGTMRAVATIALRLPEPVCHGCPDGHDFLPQSIAAGEGAVWISSARGAVARIDPSTNRVAAVILVPGDVTGDVAVGEGSVWVAEDVLGLYRIDPTVDRVVGRVPVDGAVRGARARLAVGSVTVAGGEVWIAGGWAVREPGVTNGPGYVVAGGDWALFHLDPQTNRADPLHAGRLHSGVSWGGGDLWILDPRGQRLARVHPVTGRTLRVIRFPRGWTFAGIGAGAVWTEDRMGALHRIGFGSGSGSRSVPVPPAA